MAKTIANVRTKVEQINRSLPDDKQLTFRAWGVGTNKYYLQIEGTGEQVGPICNGASEFINALHAFEDGLYF